MTLAAPPIEAASQQVKRLCSEIQLFDLCDLESCDHRQGRYCSRTELLARFELIAERDECVPRNLVRGSANECGDEYDEDDAEGSYGCFGEDDEEEE